MSLNTHDNRKPRNLAARMGRWSARHWKTATFGWLALVAVAFAVGGQIGTKAVDPYTAGPGESGRMDRILNDGFKQPAGEKVVIQSRSLRAGDPTFDAAVNDVVARVSKVAVVQNVHRGQISKDKHTVLVTFEIRGDKNKAGDKVGSVLDRVDDAQSAHPGFFIGEFGDASAQKAVDQAAAKDLESAGVFSIPITLIILVVAFGALVAAGIPLLLALTAVFATFGLMALPSHVLPMAQEVKATVLLIGLAVGVDYSMFYLRREREERAAGRSERAALEAAAATSGRSVLISGMTVMVAMAGLFLTGDATFASFGVATILVVAVAVLGSLTVLPALLSKLGDRVDRLRVPHIGRRHGAGGEGRVWGAIVDGVLRRPVLSVVVSGGLLLALAAPAFGLRMVQPGPDTYPQSLDVIKAYNHMQQAFPGSPLPANVVVKTQNVNAPAVRNAIRELESKALATGRVGEPITVETNPDATVANITVPIKGKGTDAAQASLAALRDTVVPETVGALPNTQAGVTGLTAEWRDSQEQLKAKLPIVVGFVLLFALGLLLVAFRSIVVAIKAIVLNLLSVAAAYGVLVLVFQDGFGRGLLGFSDTSGITPVVPMLLFVILFGLSMDYHVLIVSRIRESFQRGAGMDEAISQGIRSTAGVVTSAAIVMVGAFSIFGTLSLLMFKQFGVGLAAAILIDATIVRGVLLPATMKLLGERNWYLPRWLQWLPKFDLGELEIDDEPEAESEQAPATRRRRRRLGAARITGLLLIAILALGLVYLKAAFAADKVSVPAGAKAGQLTLHPCHYGTEQGSHAADCGTLVVPENRAKPGSRLIALPVTRIKARSDHPGAPVFRLEGGPGISNTHFAKASRFADRHDVVLVGYRGVDGSVKLACPEVESAVSHSTDILGPKFFRAYGDAFKACATRLRADGVDLAGYGMTQQVDDLEAARKALGYKRIDLVSESVGTRLALIYAWRYPKSIHRSVLIAVNPPGHFIWDAKTTDEQIRRYAALCRKDDSCSERTDDLAATMRQTAADIPDRFLFLPIEKGTLRVASFYGLMETTSETAPLSAPMTLGSWLSAADGDASGFWFMSLLGQLFFPKSFVWGEMAAVIRPDAAAANAYYASGRADRQSILGKGQPGTDFHWGGGRLVDSWPATPGENEYSRLRTSNVPTLLIGGQLDLTTPPQIATKELLPYLPNGQQVVLQGFGHSTSFWTEQPEAGTRLVNTFLDSGRIDTSLYKEQKVDFTPEVTDAALGKGFAGTMLGLPVVVVLSLLLMWRRLRKRGRFGRTASVLLRSLYTLVLGLGGWFAGVVIVQLAFPAVPLDDVRLAVLSIGAPIGLGIYLAWANRDLSAGARTVGLWAAAAGALVGAWLGFHAGTGLLAVITTIVGAALGANLTVLALDISVDRRVRDRSAETTEALEARPSTG